MANFRIDQMGELARQMGFTPIEARAAQIDAAEELLLEIDPARAYPFAFIIFRITGYHPKQLQEHLLTGLALQHDLGLLIERVSDSLDMLADAMRQPVLMIEQVCERFNVTSKTIQRWRRRGLASRRFIFSDGKKRVGFLGSTVERFLAKNRDQVERTANFNLVDDAERGAILNQARRLAGECRCCPEEIGRRIGKRLNRSPLTIAHLISRHDLENPGSAIFAMAGRPIDEAERARIARLIRRGMPIAALARRLGRTRVAVYRVMMDQRLERLGRRKIKFIDDPLYHQPGAAAAVDAIAAARDVMTESQPELCRVPRDLPPYLQSLYCVPLLTPAQERGLFLKLNFHKFEFVTRRRRLDPQFAGRREVDLLESARQAACAVKNRIVNANLRLVVSVARKHMRPGLSLMELISDGNLTLMRAVDSFDFHKGNRFSTYATLALMKGFARSVGQMLSARHSGIGTPALEKVAAASGGDAVARKDEIEQMFSTLDERERIVLRGRFGLGEAAERTFDEVASALGLSKHRVRQIEQGALAKLRARAGTE